MTQHPIERYAAQKGLKQRAVAKALGCSQANISLVYQGKRFGSHEFWETVEKWTKGRVAWEHGRAWYRAHKLGGKS